MNQAPKPTQQDAPTDAPLSGKWHHGNGILCCGSLRIAAIDIDTQPAEAVQAEILDWMCARLNAPAQDAERERDGWIDVSEQKPTEAQEVLFVRGGKTVHGAWIGGIFWHSNQKCAALYWRPMPVPLDAARAQRAAAQGDGDE